MKLEKDIPILGSSLMKMDYCFNFKNICGGFKLNKKFENFKKTFSFFSPTKSRDFAWFLNLKITEVSFK
jgi:hypothetical protein